MVINIWGIMKYNGKQKQYTKTNNDRHNTTQKTKIK